MEIVGRLSLSRRRGLVLLDRSDCDQTGCDQRLQLPLPGGVSVAAQVDGERQRNGGADGMRVVITLQRLFEVAVIRLRRIIARSQRSEEHTSELQSLMRISYA